MKTKSLAAAVLRDCEELLRELVSLPTPGTREDAGQRVVAKRLAEVCDHVGTNVHGNVLGVIGEGAATRLLLTAHIDEVAIMISHIDERGFLYFAPLGGSKPDALVGQRITIHSRGGPVPGAVGRRPGPAPKEEILAKDLWIDIGAHSRTEAARLVTPGDPATVNLGLERLVGDGVAGRGLDDRAGVAAMIAAMRIVSRQKRRLKVSVYALSATQEEAGQHRGAAVGAFAIRPHVCLVMDLGYATDCPQSDPRESGVVRLCGGPIVSVSLTTNRRVNRMLAAAAGARGVPLQYAVEPRSTGTDGDTIASSGPGVATGVVSIPGRYMHSPSEVISLTDLAWTAELVAEFALRLPKAPDFRPFPEVADARKPPGVGHGAPGGGSVDDGAGGCKRKR